MLWKTLRMARAGRSTRSIGMDIILERAQLVHHPPGHKENSARKSSFIKEALLAPSKTLVTMRIWTTIPRRISTNGA